MYQNIFTGFSYPFGIQNRSGNRNIRVNHIFFQR